MKSQLAEVQTGFEPLFFHIQADFQWQRPFSEGKMCIRDRYFEQFDAYMRREMSEGDMKMDEMQGW